MAERTTSIKVLDKGYITLLDTLGDDWTPVRAARISYDQFSKGEEADKKLLRYLIKNNHTSPFEQVRVVWEVKAPIFVFREWHRHRTASLNEVSGRYVTLGNEFYFPAEWRAQDEINKQGSIEGVLSRAIQDEATRKYDELVRHAIEVYDWMIENGIAREQARNCHLVSIYSKMVWQNDLHNTWHFLKLRTGSGAQWEIRQYAKAMIQLLEEQFPILMGLWREENERV